MKITERVTLISFILVPFVVLVGHIIHEGHRVSIFLAGIVILASLIRNIWFRIFVWYWVIWVLALMYLGNQSLVPAGSGQHAYIITGILGSAMIFYVAMQESQSKLTTIFNFICISAVIQSLLAILQIWDVDPFFSFMLLYANVEKLLDSTTTVGSLGNNNFLAVYLAICLPFFYRRYWCLYIPVLVAVLLTSLTSTAIVAAMIGSFVFVYNRIKWRWIILSAIPFIIYLCFIKASLTWNFTWDHDRFHWWRSAIFFWRQTWEGMIFGFGPGMSWGKSFPIHNEWITALFNYGIIGFCIAVAYFVTAWRKNRHLYSAFITAAITMNGTYPLHLAPTIMLIMIILGLMEREKLNAHRELHNDRSV